jgi:ABC-type sugar transport system ATPase subunit
VANVWKTFPGVTALAGVDLVVENGSVHGLVGQNGSGKSTLIRIVAGADRPDPGAEVELLGRRIDHFAPQTAQAAGVAVIYQELTIIPNLSAMENVFLEHLPRRRGMLARREMRSRFTELAGRLSLDVDPDAPAGELSVAHQTLVEVMRAVSKRAGLVIMDEVTAALGAEERESVYGLIERLRAAGIAVVFVSHDLDEVLRVSDHVSVLREGQLAGSRERSEWDKASLVQQMLGSEAADRLGAPLLAPSERAERSLNTQADSSAAAGEPALRVTEMVIQGRLGPVSLELRAGEVTGIAGFVGSGRSTLLRGLAGAVPVSSGEMRLDGGAVRWPRSVSSAIAQGIALVPEDRKTDGIVPDMAVYDNVTLSDLRAVSRYLTLASGRSLDGAKAALDGLSFRGLPRAPIATLSGGNQQKCLLARWLHRPVRVLLLDEPTRGIDIGAKEEVLTTIAGIAAEGVAIAVVSSELEELLAASDRVLVFTKRNRIEELPQSEWTLESLLHRLFETRVSR